MNVKNVFLLCLALLAGGWGPAAANELSADAAHQQAVTEMLEAAGTVDAIFLEMDRVVEAKGHQGELFKFMQLRTTREDILAAFVPAYAPLVTTATALEIAQAYNTPAGRKAVAYADEKARAGGKIDLAKWTVKEYQVVSKFNSGAASRKFAALSETGEKAGLAAFGTWIYAQQNELLTGAIAEMDRNHAANPVAEGKPPTQFVAVPVGISYVDEWLTLIAHTRTRGALAEWRITQDLKSLGVFSYLAPASLAAPEMVAANLATMSKVDALYEAYLVEQHAALKEFGDAAFQIETERRLETARLDNITRDQKEGLAELGRASRAVLRTTRLILAFADTRKGRLRLHEGKLQFASKEDLDTYHAYIGQLNRDSRQLSEIQARYVKQQTNWL